MIVCESLDKMTKAHLLWRISWVLYITPIEHWLFVQHILTDEWIALKQLLGGSIRKLLFPWTFTYKLIYETTIRHEDHIHDEDKYKLMGTTHLYRRPDVKFHELN